MNKTSRNAPLPLDFSAAAGVFDQLNAEQLVAVLRRGNAVVAAGAGSGKTYVLACRYVYLVVERGLAVDQILALTFTKKATAEMYRRIYSQLERISQRGGGAYQARAAQAVADFYRARIQTLDSYAGAVAREAALRYGIRPDFVTDDERCREIAEREALPFLLTHRNNPAVAALFRESRPPEIASGLFARAVLLCSAIDSPPDFAQEAAAQANVAAAEWETLSARVSGILRDFARLYEEAKRPPALEREAAPLYEALQSGAVEIPDAETLRAYLAGITAAQSAADKTAYAARHPVRTQALTVTRFLARVKSLPKRGSHPVLGAVRALGEAFDSFSALAVFAAQFGVISAVFDLLNLFQERFLRQKRVEGVLSFDDVARLARASLAAYPDVRQAEKTAYRAIMIDEFQDNNALQRDMLFLLAEKPECCADGVPKPEDLSPDKLFFVGDEKQSIYRFRGADVSVFRALKTDLARSRESGGGTNGEFGTEASGGTGTELRLKNNYRSAKELIGVFNALFGGSAYSPSGDAETGRFAGVFLPNTPEAPSPVYEAEYVPVCHPAANADETAGAGNAADTTGTAAPHSNTKINTDVDKSADMAKSPNGINAAGTVPLNEAKTSADKAGKMPAVPSPDISANDKPVAGRIPSECRICVLDKNAEADGTDERGDLLSAAESEAAFVARQIHALTGQGGFGGADILVQATVRYGDIAILLRSYSSLHYYEKHLRALGIPYAADRIGSFFADAPVNDLVRLLRLVVHPADTDAYAAVLRSPLVGLSYESLLLCLAAREASDSPETQPFGEVRKLALAETARYARGRALYGRLCEQSRTHSVCELLTEIWYNEGYRYETLWNAAVTPYRELYDYLFELAREADAEGAGLSGFVDGLLRTQRADERIDSLEISLEREEAVRLLSIHKSKGLEFPVVFVCGCGQRGRGDQSGLVYRAGGRIGIKPPLPPELASSGGTSNYFFDRGKAEAKAQRRAELRRLLYVAATRAERQLYVTGAFPVSGKDGNESTDNGQAGSFPARLKRAVQAALDAQDKKREKAGDSLTNVAPEADSALDNDTLFGLLLPAYVSRIGDDGAAPEHFFPALEEIPLAGRFEASAYGAERGAGQSANIGAEARERLLLRFRPLYQNAAAVHTPAVPRRRLSPSSLAAAACPSPAGISASFSAAYPPSLDSLIAEIDALCAAFARNAPPHAEPRFTPADFGTVAHACVESLFAGQPPRVPPRIAAALSAPQHETALRAGSALAEAFMATPLGALAAGAAVRKTEYRFRTRLAPDGEGVFIDGAIDLLFESGGTAYAVDFKTDARENPAEHTAQLACYARAASALQGKPCRAYLYYLRTGHAVDMTGAVSGIDLPGLFARVIDAGAAG